MRRYRRLYKEVEQKDLEQKKFRHEFKYVCSEAQLASLKARLTGIMKYDTHADGNGKYQIRSVYFDDYEDTGYYENEDGTNLREKFRIRIYNNSPDVIELENKRKISGMTQKEECPIERDLCEGLLAGDFGALESCDIPVWNKFAVAWNTRELRAKVIVDYERTVFVCHQGNVRITFDRNISSSRDYAHFFEKNIAKRPIMPLGLHILEVKYDEFLPDYIYKSIELENLQRSTFSKYYLCRKYHM